VRPYALVFPVVVGVVAASTAPGSGTEQPACRQEVRLARVTADRIEREWPLRPDDAVTGFVRGVGRRLAEAAPPWPYDWTFTVVRDRSANAFAIGGGYVYVHDGTIAEARNEAEVAAVLAHEMAHELAGHFCTVRAGDASPGGWLTDLFRAVPAGRRRVGSLRQEIDPAREAEADRMSVSILRAAGYDPRAALAIAQRSACGGFGPERRSTRLGRILEGEDAAGRLDFDRSGFEAVHRQVVEESDRLLPGR
jgi:predicted Zn-dependent protease